MIAGSEYTHNSEYMITFTQHKGCTNAEINHLTEVKNKKTLLPNKELKSDYGLKNLKSYRRTVHEISIYIEGSIRGRSPAQARRRIQDFLAKLVNLVE